MAKPYDDENGVFSYEKSYKEWLKDVFNSKAYNDYPSRLRKFFTKYYKDENWLIQGNSIYCCLHQLPLKSIQEWLDFCLDQTENISNPKDKSNIKCAIKKFSEFLQKHNSSRESN